jgi:adenylate cyclase
MNAESFKRKLTAILHADIEGYSRLMGENEDETIRTLAAYRDVISALIQQHQGRLVDFIGDELLVEFTSVGDAVLCATEIQRELKIRNDNLPKDRKMLFRIGVNLGDVVEEEGRIYGDGINIAARIESLAEGGGICISGTVYDQVQNKLGLEYESLGEKEVKNIAQPIRVYRVLSSPGAAAQIEPASVDRMEHPLPEKPSIAVLPFENLSGDPGQEFFSDGLTEEIITALTKIPGLFIVARNSTFTYKGKPVKVQRVAEELGVQYVLEGSVRKGGDKIRITAQLIDALTGHHLWAERYDRDLSMKDIFEIQDGITIQILEALQIKITKAAYRGKHTDNLEAYLKAMKAFNLQSAWDSSEEIIVARQLLEDAISLDPNYSEAYVALANNFKSEGDRGLTKTPEKSYERGIEMAKKAISLDESNASAYVVLGYFYAKFGWREKARSVFERALAFAPNSPYVNVTYARYILRPEKRYEEAISYYEKAKRLDPVAPQWHYYVWVGQLYMEIGNYEKAIPEFKKYIKTRQLNDLPVLTPVLQELITCFLRLDREEEAYAAATELLNINLKYPLERVLNTAELKNNAAKDRLLDALSKAGLLQKEEEVSEGTAIKWKSDADGYGKDEVFTRNNPPAFSFEYPEDFVIHPLRSDDIFRISAPGGLPIITVRVEKITGNVKDFLHEFEERIKKAFENLGTNVRIIYNKPLPPETYGEDYPSQELEISWLFGGIGGAPLRCYINVITKGEYIISMQGQINDGTVGTVEDINRVKAIFKTINLEP